MSDWAALSKMTDDALKILRAVEQAKQIFESVAEAERHWSVAQSRVDALINEQTSVENKIAEMKANAQAEADSIIQDAKETAKKVIAVSEMEAQKILSNALQERDEITKTIKSLEQQKTKAGELLKQANEELESFRKTSAAEMAALSSQIDEKRSEVEQTEAKLKAAKEKIAQLKSAL